MKKILLLLLAVFTTIAVIAQDVEIDGVCYRLFPGTQTAEVESKNDGYTGDLEIAESIRVEEKDYKVTSIGEDAFKSCNTMTSVKIPVSVVTIGARAFQDCSAITSINIPDNVTTIGAHAFEGCNGMVYVNIGRGVNSIGSCAFYKCSNLASVYISDIEAWCNIDFNVDWTEYNNGKLSNPLTVAKRLFLNNQEITKLEIPDNIKTLKDGVFYGWEKLLDVTIPNSVVSIGKYAFGRCGLTSVDIPNSVTSIGDNAFCYCTDLSSISIGNSVTTINRYAFLFCKSLSSITIPNSVTTIGDGLFYNCHSLTNIIIPNGITDIPLEAFKNCINLKSVTLPNQLKTIRNEAFRGCLSIESITLPASTQFIFQMAFLDCSSLKKIYVMPIVPPFLSDYSFSDYSIIVKVPKGYKDVYQVADGWKNFTNIIDVEKFKLTYLVDSEEYKSYEIEEGEPITPEPAPTKDGYTFSGWSDIPETMPAKDVTVTGTFSINKYKLAYMVDNEVYKTDSLEYGATITPEAEPTKEGYTFSGWSDIPETMPAKDVTVTGTFSINKYKLAYMVDNEVYKTDSLEYGATITPEAEPTKEGYTFSGWSEIPETMPAKDVTVTGTFSINKYKLTYMVDNEVYKTDSLEYGATITPEAEPTKEGYTFSGWSEIPETMPAKDVSVTGSFTAITIVKYTLTYKVDGEVYKTYELEEGAVITPEPAPTKEGYTFSGWSDIPETMPAKDVTVTGTFSINKYKLIYMIDGEEYKSYDIEYGATITPEAEPTKEGYTFSGWSEIPETMPAKDVSVTGSFTAITIVKYTLTYKVDGEVYKTYELEEGAAITPEPAPTKEGYTFSGWSDIPETMPAKDITVTGTFSINKYKLTYMVDNEVYKTDSLEYGAIITPEAEPTKEGYTFSGWSEIPETMPAKDVTVTGTFTQIDYDVAGVTYEVSGDQVSIIKADEYSGDVEISSTVVINDKTYTVTSIGVGAFLNNTNITSVTIPESVTSIGANAFDGCSGLTSIIVGKAVTSIGSKAFANLTPVAKTRSDGGLTISCYATSVPTTADDAFENTSINKATLLVYDNSVSAYKVAAPWSEFGTIMGFNEAAGIGSVLLDNCGRVKVFNIDGKPLNEPHKGINIIRMDNGKTKKVVVK